MTTVKISPGNRKLGTIPNVSLIPVADCGNCEACKSSCYALKAWKMYPATRAMWRNNSKEFREAPFTAMLSVHEYFQGKKMNLPRFFRIHVGGDFLNQNHVLAWCSLARTWVDVKFLAFTKMHHLDYSMAPANMQVVLSMFPLMEEPQAGNSSLPKAWVMKDKEGNIESRVPGNAIECPGNCESCAMCWNLNTLDRDVVFDFH